VCSSDLQVTAVDVFGMCHQITAKLYQPTSGQYNNYIINFARYACRYGISEGETLSELLNICSTHNGNETKASVRGVYTKFATEFNTWQFKQKGVRYSKQNNDSNVVVSSYNEDVLFWYEITNDKTNKVEYRFSYDRAIIFLHNNGFYKYPLDNDYYQLIHVNEKLKQVKVIQPLAIKEFFITFLKSKYTDEFDQVREMFRRGAKNYCSSSQLEGLDYYKPIFKRDNKDTAFVYFNNYIVQIHGTNTTLLPYTKLDGYIWSKQVINFDYKDSVYTNSDFYKFVNYAIIGAKKDSNTYTEVEHQKIESFETTIGYLLHKYKNPAITKAVVAVDKRLRSAGENNGRTGKSLLSKALAKMLNVCLIDGKNFKFDSPFPFQKANIDTELVNFNDVLKNYDFERLFGMITEDFTFEKKGKDSITLNFEDAPKFYISTNTTLKGSGESNKGRQQIIEFSSYFSTDYTPVTEFGRMFFYDWDATEYAMFYSYMAHCLQQYLAKSLVPFPLENYDINKLIDTAGEEFVDYMDDIVLSQLKHVKEFDCKKLYEGFITDNKHRANTQIKTFNKNVKMYADINKLAINAHKQGERDKRNNISYFTFTYIDKQPTETTIETHNNLPF
jgi:hypothetical protein